MMKKTVRILMLMLCTAILMTGCGKEKQPTPKLPEPVKPPSSSSAPAPSSSQPEAVKPDSSSAPESQSSSSAPASSEPQKPEVQETMKRGATVRADGGLRLRAAASQNSDKLLTIPDGTHIICTGWKSGWAKTEYKGKTGYVSAVYLLFDGRVQADGGLRLRSGPGTSYDKLLTIPNGTVIPCMEQKDGWIKTAYNGKTGYVSQDYVGVSVTVYASSGLNLRKAPDENAEKLAVIPNGTCMICRGNKENEWALVDYNGQTGYVSYLYIAYDGMV